MSTQLDKALALVQEKGRNITPEDLDRIEELADQAPESEQRNFGMLIEAAIAASPNPDDLL